MGPAVTDAPPINQDVPPAGGFAPVRIRKNAKNKFWRPGTMYTVVTLIMLYGWWKLAVAERRR
jgi:hypothetical protein